MECRSCKSTKLREILNLGNHAWCNNFLRIDQVGKEKLYPLTLLYCDDCTLLQLSYTVPKEVMFKDHTYVSGTTETLTKHFLDLAKENKEQFHLKDDDLIIDIGGNDGTQLLQYKSLGFKNLMNIESADNIAKISVKNGIPVVNEFVNEDIMKDCFDVNSAKLINASGIFFHLEELHSVIRGIKYCLARDGIFVVQFMYAGTMIEKLNFDTIYHEHLCYYTLKSLENLLHPYGLEVFDAYYSDIHSGSIIAKITHSHEQTPDKTARYVKTKEQDDEYTLNRFEEFANQVVQKQDDLKRLLVKLKGEGKKVYAYGAPAKGNTLLTYFDIDRSLIDKCVEVNPLKIGKYLPKSHIPIIEESKNDIPDYYLLLSHNFANEILEKNKDLMFNLGVQFIIPFPDVKVINKVAVVETITRISNFLDQNHKFKIPGELTQIKIDVGLGRDAPNSALWLVKNPGRFVFAVEPLRCHWQHLHRLGLPDNDVNLQHPTKWYIIQLHDNTVKLNRNTVCKIGNRFRGINCAIDDVKEPTIRSFYEMCGIGSGSSSLLKPTKAHPQKFKALVKVVTLSLEFILDRIPWDRFDYIEHIKTDCEGYDFTVVKSIGKYLDRIVFISSELSTNLHYWENTHDYNTFVSYMQKRNFKIVNRAGGNIHFMNLKYSDIIKRDQLSNITSGF